MPIIHREVGRNDGEIPGDPPAVLEQIQKLLKKARLSYLLTVGYRHGENEMITYDLVGLPANGTCQMKTLATLAETCNKSIELAARNLAGEEDDEDGEESC